MNALKTIGGSLLMVLVLGSLGACLDGPEDHSHEWAESTNLQALRKSEEGSARRQEAAQALCHETHGESVALWTATGDLVCRPRRLAKAQVQL